MIRDCWIFGRRTRTFTLQWHLTNACPFHCRHCYDRSDRGEISFAEALRVLADFQTFCGKRRVAPRLSLSGGDPLVCSYFWELYEAIAKARIPVSILGNPIGREPIERLLGIQRPTYYQVSLEGLGDHNDAVRGAGHFARTMDFLADARRCGLYTHVMLTLTQANLEEVLPLGDHLRGLTSRFTFNRLAQVGNGHSVEAVGEREYEQFLERYLQARRANPVLGVKDNLFSILRLRSGRQPFRGCTGFGCGAAFNFVALLPDGEVHACRKFPSPLGSILKQDLGTIYDSAAARRYRDRPAECHGCRLLRHCGGCPAVAYGRGLDPLRNRDPYCFLA